MHVFTPASAFRLTSGNAEKYTGAAPNRLNPQAGERDRRVRGKQKTGLLRDI